MRTLVIFAIFVLATNLLAQDDIGLGTYTLGGEISFTSSFEKDADESNSRLLISPSCYFFVSRYVALGGLMMFSYSEDVDMPNIYDYGVGPGIRFFIHPHQKFKINLGLEYLYRKMKVEYEDPIPGIIEDYTITTWDLSFTVGFDIFIAKNVALEPFIRLNRETMDYSKTYPLGDKDTWMFEITEGIRIAIFIF